MSLTTPSATPWARTTPHTRHRRVEPAHAARAEASLVVARSSSASHGGGGNDARPPPRAAPVRGRRRLTSRGYPASSRREREEHPPGRGGDDRETVRDEARAAPTPAAPSPDGLDLAMAMDGADFFPARRPRPARSSPSFTVRTSSGRPSAREEERRAAAAPRATPPTAARGGGPGTIGGGDGGDDDEDEARFDELLSRVSSARRPTRRGVGPTDRTARRSFAGKNAGKLPETLDALVVVEGVNDAKAVQRAFRPRSGCRVLKGAYDAAAGHYDVPDAVVADIARIAEAGTRVVVLTDSDVAGRQMRGKIVRQAPDAYHAFLGTHLSSARADTATHRAGNVGVEHASAENLRDAVAGARRAACAGGSAGVSRREFTRGDLERWGLCGPSEGAPDPRWSAFGRVGERRRLVGEYLGVGECDAKQLVRQLNLFFTRAEVDAALSMLPGEGEAVPRKMTDGRADRMVAKPNGDDDEEEFDLYAYYPPGVAPPGFE